MAFWINRWLAVGIAIAAGQALAQQQMVNRPKIISVSHLSVYTSVRR